MQSAARFMGHPIHPMLIPYPFAFLSGATAFDAAAVSRGDESLARTATHLRNAGIVAALGAAVPGLVDYLAIVPDGRPRETATKHLLSNVTALGCFGLAAWTANGRDEGAPPGAATLALEVVGTALLAVGGWLGGTLAYHHLVGVTPEEPSLLHGEKRPTRATPVAGPEARLKSRPTVEGVHHASTAAPANHALTADGGQRTADSGQRTADSGRRLS